MEIIQYKELDTDESLLEQTEKLFIRMYEYMSKKGLLLPLVPGGEKMWSKSIMSTLGKFGVVWLALRGTEVVGFAQGMIKLLPNYLGGGKVGVISHIYVNPDLRQSGIGSKLVHKLEEWFNTKEVESIELQVLCHNETGRAFWSKMGYQYECYQMRKLRTGVGNEDVHA